MSIERPIEVECPRCGKTQASTVWDSLNADVSPEARIELLQGKINVFACRSCGANAFIPVPLMYHDMRRQFVVQYFPVEGLDHDEFLSFFAPDGTHREMTSTVKCLRDVTGREMGPNYMLHPHIVFDMGELVRYIVFRERVFDRGQDPGEVIVADGNDA